VLQGVGNAVDEIETTRPSPSSGAAGTVPYMAPELIRGAQPSIRSDIWALGVLLFEMVVGRRPFSGSTPYEMASNILVNQRTHMQVLLDDSLRAIVDRCLSIDPAGRYGSARELEAELPQRFLPRLRRGRTGPMENRTGLSV
jgi:serine/threonine protein kinase